MNLVNFSIKQPFYILLFWTLILFFGIYSFNHLPVLFLDKDRFIHLSIETAYPGEPKARVLDVTKALEKELLKNPRIETVYSTTQNESSSIKTDFKLGVTEFQAIEQVFLAVNQAKANFPQGVSDPVIQVIGDLSIPLFTIAATSELSAPEFYNFAMNQIKPYFEQIKGISNVSIVGQRQNQATICLDLQKMKEREISASEVISQLKRTGTNIIVDDDINYFLSGEFSSLRELGSIPITFLSNDKAILLQDIADIHEELTEPTAYTYLNKTPCLLLEVYSHNNADLFSLEKSFFQKMEVLQKELKHQNISLVILNNREPNVMPMLGDFYRNLLIAIAISIAIIWFSFKGLSSIAISVTSIPFSICGAFCVLYLFGSSLTINIILALLVAVGLIIDDLIIIRENIFRYIEKGHSPFEATRLGMREISSSVYGTTCTIFSVAIPLIIYSGTEVTQHLKPFGIALLAAMTFSLLEAVTLGPLLCAYCLKKVTSEKAEPSYTQKGYDKCLIFVQKYPLLIIGTSLGLLVAGLFAAKFVRTEGASILQTGSFTIHIDTLQGIPFEENRQNALSFSDQITRRYSDIADLGLRIEKNEQFFYVDMVEKKQRKLTPLQLGAEISNELKALTTAGKIKSFYIQNNNLAPSYAPEYTLELISNDSDQLLEYSNKMLHILEQSNSLSNLQSSSSINQLEQSIAFNFSQMSLLGVELTPVANEFDALLNIKNLKPRYHPPHKTDATKEEIKIKNSIANPDLYSLQKYCSVPNMNNALIPIEKITEKIERNVVCEIKRKNGEEFIQITGNNNLQSLSTDPMRLTETVIQKGSPPPEKITWSWAGFSQKQKDASAMLPHLGLLAICFIYITLVLLYQSITLPIIVLLPLPLAYIGSMVALLVMNQTVNQFSVIGVILPFGIAAKNGIILINFTRQLISQGIAPAEAIFIAARVRLRPILLTSIGVILTTIPIMIHWNPYTKLQFSLGIAIMGGLTASLFMSLMLIPAAFKYVYSFCDKINQSFIKRLNQE